MRRFRFGLETGRPLDEFGSRAAIITRLARSQAADLRLHCVYLAAGGLIGRHPASGPQLLCVLAGAGQVCGQDEVWQALAAGQAAFWEAGEWHATRSAAGLTALIAEGAGLEPGMTELR